MPRIVRSMTARDFEGRALDLLDRMPVAERGRLALFLRLSGLASGDRGFLTTARDVERGLPTVNPITEAR
jgi:hypothetical protein